MWLCMWMSSYVYIFQGTQIRSWMAVVHMIMVSWYHEENHLHCGDALAHIAHSSWNHGSFQIFPRQWSKSAHFESDFLSTSALSPGKKLWLLWVKNTDAGCSHISHPWSSCCWCNIKYGGLLISKSPNTTRTKRGTNNLPSLAIINHNQTEHHHSSLTTIKTIIHHH